MDNFLLRARGVCVRSGHYSLVEEAGCALSLAEAEAINITVALYEKFLYAERDVFTSGGEDVAEMRALATENMQEYVDDTVEMARVDKFTIQGDMSIIAEKTTVRSFTDDTITAFLCIDAKDSQMFDSSGNPTDSNRRGVIQPVEVRVTGLNSTPRIDKALLWDIHEKICQ